MSVTRDNDDLFEMANLSAALTGLPMVVWVSERGRARHDQSSHGTWSPDVDRQYGDCSIYPIPRLIAGQLSAADMQAVREWIQLNEAALVDYWNGRIYTDELIQRLQRLP